VHPAGCLSGTGDAAQVRLYLAGLVLAHVEPGADRADAGHPPGFEVGGEQLGRRLGVTVQPGEFTGYGRGYGVRGHDPLEHAESDRERGRGGERRHGRAVTRSDSSGE